MEPFLIGEETDPESVNLDQISGASTRYPLGILVA